MQTIFNFYVILCKKFERLLLQKQKLNKVRDPMRVKASLASKRGIIHFCFQTIDKTLCSKLARHFCDNLNAKLKM